MSATAARIALVTEARRRIPKTDATVKTKNSRAREITVDTLLANKTDAQTEADRQFPIVKEERRRYAIPVAGLRNDIKIKDTITVDISRFGLSGGKLFIVVGRSRDFTRNLTIFRVYG